MADLDQQLREDRAMRNAAKGLVKGSLGNVKGDMAQAGLGARIFARAKDGAAEIADNSSDFARENRSQLGAGLVVGALAVVGWMFRDQIADAVYNLVNSGDDDSGDEASASEEGSPAPEDHSEETGNIEPVD